ncbi:TPA: helix-turn-helix transcriptional regulator [Clostridioides difficile]|nr:helix-turn-helix transcriptional regulator [Clostridioides difficile]HBF3756690.1 helix-turn-helix transcriptional regulator [Clostridioides difficile]HBF6247027.1 helix-turn-helix transcriptional regulator [Clostridioides difficile]HBY3218596.1 helix-turn-helix transcriptional regulator [Clostridioides difficile]
MNNERDSYIKFKCFLIENNIRQKDIAKLLNVSESTLSKKINGKGGDFSIQELKIICKKCNLKAEVFFN